MSNNASVEYLHIKWRMARAAPFVLHLGTYFAIFYSIFSFRWWLLLPSVVAYCRALRLYEILTKNLNAVREARAAADRATCDESERVRLKDWSRTPPLVWKCPDD